MAKKQEKKEEKNSGHAITILKNLKGASLPLEVLLFSQKMEIGKLVKLSPGNLLLFDTPETSRASLRVQGVPFAEGKVVKVGEHYGIEVEEIVSDGKE